jgi:hypothetical protein
MLDARENDDRIIFEMKQANKCLPRNLMMMMMMMTVPSIFVIPHLSSYVPLFVHNVYDLRFSKRGYNACSLLKINGRFGGICRLLQC